MNYSIKKQQKIVVEPKITKNSNNKMSDVQNNKISNTEYQTPSSSSLSSSSINTKSKIEITNFDRNTKEFLPNSINDNNIKTKIDSQIFKKSNENNNQLIDELSKLHLLKHNVKGLHSPKKKTFFN